MPVSSSHTGPFTNLKIAVRRNFNMVEMALALGVVAVGLISILALFPIGLSASRDAMATSYSSDVAEQMIHQMEYMIRLPDADPSTPGEQPGWSNYVDVTTYLPQGKPTDVQLLDFTDTVGTGNTPVDGTGGIIFRKPVTPGVFTAFVPGVFKIYRYTDKSGGTANQFDPTDMIDFQVVLAVWNEQVQIPGNPALSYDIATKLNVELSWPAQLPYARRQKSFYTKELFKR